ncbi:MAG: GNAT family N-acetyltransferase [Acidobacteriota bacterium]
MSGAEKRYHFDEAYREVATLGDGTEVLLRTLRQSDRDGLLDGFDKLSPESRYFRFLTNKARLTEEDLDRLLSVDGVNHFALVALSTGRDRAVGGLGVARFVRLEDEPEVAEPAITVVDHAQKKGLGSLLLHRLGAAARERGIKRFLCQFLASNLPVRRLLEEYSSVAVLDCDESGLVRAEVPVPEVDPSAYPTPADRHNIAYRLLSDSARGRIRVRLGRLLLKHDDR